MTPDDAGDWWGRETFLSYNERSNICPEVIDATGRARYLFFGPFIVLPPGLWRATVYLELCPDAARRQLALQFGAEPDYTTLDLPQGMPGRHVERIEHPLFEPAPCQIRLWLKKAAFHGEIRFSGAHVARLGDAPQSEPGEAK